MDPNTGQAPDIGATCSSPLVIKQFQLCKKAEIQQEKITIKMRVQTSIPDDEAMDECVSLTYTLELGELHSRDKYNWVESIQDSTPYDSDSDILFKKVKHLDFCFKMNHIKQVMKLEISGNFKKKNVCESKVIY